METLTIGNQPVGPDEPTFIIAEAGSNHNGDLETAKELVDVAADAGADAVKFQTFRANKMYPDDHELQLLDSDESAYDLFKRLEMPYEWIEELYQYARSRDLYFISTPFDNESADELADYIPAYKVPSSLLVHHPFLEYLSQQGKPIIMSTGGKTIQQVEDAVDVIRNSGSTELILLQCTTAYPTPIDRANLQVIRSYREQFDLPTGLSDHTVEPSIAPTMAVALGANVIEKHITLDKSMDGPDQFFSLEPDQFKQMVTHVRKAETAMGSGEKTVLDVEQETPTGEPCIHAVEDLSPGDRISDSNTAFLRPVDDNCILPPSEFDSVMGKEVCTEIESGSKIRLEDLL